MDSATVTSQIAKKRKPQGSWRETVVLENLPLIQTLARPLSEFLSPAADWNDLCQAGALGLLQAADSYEPAMCGGFDLYARAQIEGEMIRVLKKSHAPAQTPARPPQSGYDARPVETAAVDAPESRPDRLLEQHEIHDRLANAIGRLPVRYGKVLIWYYSEDMSLRQIASRLGVSESRIGQIRDKALQKVSSDLRSGGFAPPFRMPSSRLADSLTNALPHATGQQ